MKSIEKDKYQDICDVICLLCSEFDDKYYCKIDEVKVYFEEFVNKLIKVGWLVVFILEEFGGLGFGLIEVFIIMEEINRLGGNFGVCYGQMYNMNMLLCYGFDKQKEFWLLWIVIGEWCLQLMGVIEFIVGIDIIRIKIIVVKREDWYVING